MILAIMMELAAEILSNHGKACPSNDLHIFGIFCGLIVLSKLREDYEHQRSGQAKETKRVADTYGIMPGHMCLVIGMWGNCHVHVHSIHLLLD